MAKAIFTVSVTTKLNVKMDDTIRKSLIGSPEMKKEIQRVLQMANRRAQNIEKSGVASPAYQALVLQGRQGYSKFRVSGLDIKNEYDWEVAKREYADAIAYLQNPTSTSTGAKQYVNHIAKDNNIPFSLANNIVKQSTNTEFVDNKIPFLNYRSVLDEYLKDVNEELRTMNKTADELAKAMENQVEANIKAIKQQIDTVTETVAKTLIDGFKMK